MLRKMTVDEQQDFFKKKAELQTKLNEAHEQTASKSRIKKLKAENHNEWQAYLRENQVVTLMGRLYTEKGNSHES